MRYIGFLRGINVGGRTIPMTALRTCCEEMGLKEVSTVLQTGNVLFESAKSAESLKSLMQAGLGERFDYPVHVQIFPLATVRKIVDASPFSESDLSVHSYVVFFENGLEKQLMAEVGDEVNELDLLEVGNGVIYWRVAKGSTLQSPLQGLSHESQHQHTVWYSRRSVSGPFAGRGHQRGHVWSMFMVPEHWPVRSRFRNPSTARTPR
jgi:uncharacterized protein (DUF1697 family)